jgi:hypothetical protein
MREFRPILGNAARKDPFFPRPKIRKDILEALELNQNFPGFLNLQGEKKSHNLIPRGLPDGA